jgi:LmbE family N-acetylglucosaminyl deacetylase
MLHDEVDPGLRTILAVGAHPDDVELGCAGTLALHTLKGDKVYLLVLTKGEASGNPELREKECRESAKILGATDVFMGGIQDTKIDDGRATIDVIEGFVDKLRPDIVYAPSSKDTHQDHRNTGHAVLSACRRCRVILLYEGASTQRDFNPQVFVDITKTFQMKLKAISLFASQVENHGGYSRAVKAIEGLAKFRGYQAGAEVAEAFEVGKYIFEI